MEELDQVQMALDVSHEYNLTAEVVLSIITASKANPTTTVSNILNIALSEWDLL